MTPRPSRLAEGCGPPRASRGRVGGELRLSTPTLTFFHDDTAERAQRLERLMDEQA